MCWLDKSSSCTTLLSLWCVLFTFWFLAFDFAILFVFYVYSVTNAIAISLLELKSAIGTVKAVFYLMRNVLRMILFVSRVASDLVSVCNCPPISIVSLPAVYCLLATLEQSMCGRGNI